MKPIFIAGPCVIESQELLECVAETLLSLNSRHGIDIIFKSSFDKANRTSGASFRGPGIERGLRMLADVKSKYGLSAASAREGEGECGDRRWREGPQGHQVTRGSFVRKGLFLSDGALFLSRYFA